MDGGNGLVGCLVEEGLELEPPGGVAHVGEETETADALHHAAIVLLENQEGEVCSPNEDDGGKDGEQQLEFEREPDLVEYVPNAHDNEVDGDHGDGGDAVADACRDEFVVEMGAVGKEGRTAVKDAASHDAEGVHDGHRGNGEKHGGKTHDLGCAVDVDSVDGSDGRHGLHDAPGDKEAHNHGAGVADVHAAAIAKDVVEREGDEGAGKAEGDDGVHVGASLEEEGAHEDGDGDAETAGKAVYTVDHVEGVDDAHTGKYGERYANVPREFHHSAQAVEMVDTSAGGEYQTRDNQGFSYETREGGETDGVVEHAKKEHD